MLAASTGTITMEAPPVAVFHSTEARCSCTSGCGDRFSKGKTSCAGSRRTRSASTAPVSSQAARRVSWRESAALLSTTITTSGDWAGRGSAGEEGQVEGARGGAEPGDTFAPRSEGQMPPYALKRFTVLQVRDQLADE